MNEVFDMNCDWCHCPLTQNVPTLKDKLGQSFHWDCYDAYRCQELKKLLEANKSQ